MKQEKDGIVVDLKQKVTVYGTGKSKSMPKGAAFEVHPIHAETLVKNGFAQHEMKMRD